MTTSRPLCVLLLTALLLACAAPVAAAAPAPSVAGGVSDNYKARYNADPSVPEHRTWLSMDALFADSATWTPAVPTSDHATTSTLQLTSNDGRSGTLSVAVARGSLGLTVLRTDRPTASVDHVRWGVLTTVNNPDALVGQSALVRLTLTVGSSTLAEGLVEYRHEPAFDGVASTHIEWNGPRGRWWVGNVALRTDWEPVTNSGGITASPIVTGRPRVTRIAMPLRTSNRHVPVRVTGRNAGPKITSIRFRIGSARWSRWQRVAPRYRLTLPARTATWRVQVQLRDTAGALSKAAGRSVRCSCG